MTPPGPARSLTKVDFRPDYLDPVFDVLIKRTPSELAPRWALENMRQTAGQLPWAVPGLIEVRLDQAETGADLCMDHLLPDGPAEPFPAEFLAQPAWQCVARYLDFRAGLDKACRRALKTLSLEFDIADQPARPPLPSLFLIVSRLLFDDPVGLHEAGTRRAVDPARLDIFRRAVDLLGGAEMSGVQFQTVRNILEALDGGAFASYVGLMAARGEAGFRLNVALPSRVEQSLAFLEKIGWTGRPEPLVRVLSFLARFQEHWTLVLELDQGLKPSLAVEWFSYQSFRDKQTWLTVLDWLSKQGLVHDRVAGALRGWQGYDFFRHPADPWRTPRPLILMRRLNHFKISLSHGGGPKAKAYLFFDCYRR